ncbi:DUF4131 domain-containing protein [Gammaproteobacteria bacterium]|nr:DUF4131 domain-containing protein [Gammaproteobacteria bacterium]
MLNKELNTKIIKLLALLFIPYSANTFSHHSFPVHFVPDGEVTITGVVSSFRFSNPHGVLEFTAINEAGEEEFWRAETNSPSMLRRRGWSPTSFKPGDEITVTGWPARKDDHYMRVRSATFSNGEVLSTQSGINLDQN